MLEQRYTAQTNPGDRVAAAVSYDGSRFFGWQSQRKPNLPTVQESLEQALGSVAGGAIGVQCAGRTDTGVHATYQVVHFDTPVARDEKAWVMGANANLPQGVAVHWARPVPEDFNARFSATARRYRYIIFNAPVRPAILHSGVSWERRPLRAELMHEAAQALLGEQDFSSFRAAACQSNTPMRNVHFIRVYRRGMLVVVDIQANAFLYHMVRNIVGALLEVGSGGQPPAWIGQLLQARDRTLAAATAPPYGLYLVDVSYLREYGLPDSELGPYFLSDDFLSDNAADER